MQSLLLSYRSAIILLLLVGIQACSSHDEEKLIAAKGEPLKVKIARPVTGATGGFNISGKVVSSQTAYISTRVMGTITMLNVKEGDYVRQGQIVAMVSGSEMKAKKSQTNAMLTEAEANLQNAAKDYERYQALYNKQSATAKELENISLQYKAAQARVEAAKQMGNEVSAMIGYTQVAAPFSGVVVQKLAQAGTLANPGMPLLVIEQTGNLEIEASVPESDISLIKEGDGATVQVKSTGRTFASQITQINPSSQFTGGQFIIKIAVPSEQRSGIYSGMYVNVFLPQAGESKITQQEVMVPKQAIIYKDQLTGIYTPGKANTALLRWVKLGKEHGSLVEVLSGLGNDEDFIAEATGKLYNGVPITVTK